MAFTTPNLGLILWNLPSDPYDSTQLAGNWAKMDEHDHTPGKGLPITTAAIADRAITSDKLASGFTVADASITGLQLAPSSVTSAHIVDGTITGDDLSTTVDQSAGISSSTAIRRGKTNIATSESTSSATYTLLATPDRVSSVVLPTDGLIVVAYEALIQQSAAAGARAAIFIGSNQLQVQGYNGSTQGPQTQAGMLGGGAGALGLDAPLFSFSGGLAGGQPSSGSYAADAATGQVVGFGTTTSSGVGSTQQEIGLSVVQGGGVGGGPVYIFAAAGTYDVSVQYKTISGSVTAKNRKLWVWTVGF